MLKVEGITKEGKIIISGIEQFRATFGLSYDYIFEICKKKGFVPCWESLAREIPMSKMKELELAISDVYRLEKSV